MCQKSNNCRWSRQGRSSCVNRGSWRKRRWEVGERQMKFNNTNKAIDPATRANTHPEPRRGSRRRRGSRIETESETDAWRRRIINQLTKNQWAKAREKSRRSRRGSSSVLTVRLVGAQGSGSLFFWDRCIYCLQFRLDERAKDAQRCEWTMTRERERRAECRERRTGWLWTKVRISRTCSWSRDRYRKWHAPSTLRTRLKSFN